PDTTQWGNAVAADPQGNVIVFGTLEGTLDFGGLVVHNGGVFPFLLKLDPDGHPLWAKTFGSSVDQTPIAVAADGAGDVFIAEEAKRALVDGQLWKGAGFTNVFAAAFDASGSLHYGRIARDASDPIQDDTFP